MFRKIINFISFHKITSIVLALVLVWGGYATYQKFHGTANVTRYVLAQVAKGTLVASVNGSGQVSVSDQIDIKPKVSGDVVYVLAVAGQTIKAGAVLVQLNSLDAQNTVRDAQIALDSAKIAYQKFQLDQASTQKTRTDTLTKDYADAISQLSNSYIKLGSITQDINNVMNDNALKGGCSPNSCQYQNLLTDLNDQRAFTQLSAQSTADLNAVLDSYNSSLTAYKQLRLDSASNTDIKSMLNTTLKTLQLSAQAVKSEQNMLDTLISMMTKEAGFYGNKVVVPSQVTAYQNLLSSDTSTLNSSIGDISGSITGIRVQEDTITSAKLGDPLDVAGQQNQIAQKEATLADAKTSLANYSIRAPFDGVIANVNVQKGDSASPGTSIGTIITKQRIAQISLNEVDVTKIKVGQKATLTFDAIGGLTITGQVLQIDTIGTVSQGVVNYTVKIGFDTQDDRVKPSMSISAAIITDTKVDVLTVPSSAVKSSNNTSYVLMPADQTAVAKLLSSAAGQSRTGVDLSTAPVQQDVETGLSNDSMTEITGGLKEGDIVVTRTISSTTTTSTTSNGGLGVPGLGGGGFRNFGGGGGGGR